MQTTQAPRLPNHAARRTQLNAFTVFVFALFVAAIGLALIVPANTPFAAENPGAKTATPPSALAGRGLTEGRQQPGTRARKSPRKIGPLDRAWIWILKQQQNVNRQLTKAVRSLKTDGIVSGAFMLAFLSFAYGVLHAAGPGHGKAVISSYVLANERTVRRGIALSFLAAFIQALSAIALVAILAVAFRATSLEIRTTEAWITTLSWGFVAIVGAWLLASQLRNLRSSANRKPSSPTQDPDQQHAAISNAHAHHHDHNCADPTCCGHAHMPSAQDLEGEWSWRKAGAIALAVGIRPCTGAVLVLIFALTQGLLWAGIFATFAMAFGTALTVSALAALAVGSREFATRMAGKQSLWAARIQTFAGLVGASLVFLLGAVFFAASLQPTAPF